MNTSKSKVCQSRHKITWETWNMWIIRPTWPKRWEDYYRLTAGLFWRRVASNRRAYARRHTKVRDDIKYCMMKLVIFQNERLYYVIIKVCTYTCYRSSTTSGGVLAVTLHPRPLSLHGKGSCFPAGTSVTLRGLVDQLTGNKITFNYYGSCTCHWLLTPWLLQHSL